MNKGGELRKHKVMLEDIVAQLLARARKGLQTRVLKVKFHFGTQGNEEADRLAAAATAATDSSKCSQEYASVTRAYKASTG